MHSAFSPENKKAVAGKFPRLQTKRPWIPSTHGLNWLFYFGAISQQQRVDLDRTTTSNSQTRCSNQRYEAYPFSTLSIFLSIITKNLCQEKFFIMRCINPCDLSIP